MLPSKWSLLDQPFGVNKQSTSTHLNHSFFNMMHNHIFFCWDQKKYFLNCTNAVHGVTYWSGILQANDPSARRHSWRNVISKRWPWQALQLIKSTLTFKVLYEVINVKLVNRILSKTTNSSFSLKGEKGSCSLNTGILSVSLPCRHGHNTGKPLNS